MVWAALSFDLDTFKTDRLMIESFFMFYIIICAADNWKYWSTMFSKKEEKKYIDYPAGQNTAKGLIAI